MTKIALIILTYNAAPTIRELFGAVLQQTVQPTAILVIDSSSTDGTLNLLRQYPCQLKVIPQAEFDHGGTRKLATALLDADIYIFLTQDAIPTDKEAFANLIAAFKDLEVGCAYGRQVPKTDADILSSHMRLYYFPETTLVRKYADVNKYGIKTCFCSDSFAAYRKAALVAIGGFPENTILCEDMYVAAKMLLQNWKIAYQADAKVAHSHNYSIWQNFKATFDIGVFHAMNPWIRQRFCGVQRSGSDYALSEFRYCLKRRAYLVFIKSFFNIAGKYLGYILGLHYKIIPKTIRKKFSSCAFFWK